MDKKLTWGSHIEYARQKARATRVKLYTMTSTGTVPRFAYAKRFEKKSPTHQTVTPQNFRM